MLLPAFMVVVGIISLVSVTEVLLSTQALATEGGGQPDAAADPESRRT
jgi:hypothetical protein